MIIDSLYHLYGRYLNDPQIDIPRNGFSTQSISFEIVLEPDGTLHAISPISTDKQSKRLMVLGDTKPSGSGINPCFLWDNAVYLLGIKPEDPKPERTLECFQAYRNSHESVRGEISAPEFDAVCTFLRQWNLSPDSFEKLPEEIRGYLKNNMIGTGLFRIRNTLSYVHESPAIQQWWATRSDKKKWWEASKPIETQTGQCSISGLLKVPIARLHEPKIKGVAGSNMAGASLVSFNDSAYNSYGLEQSRNASISESVTFAYCNALNYLLARDSGRKIQLGDTTMVFWSEKPTLMEQSFLDWLAPAENKDEEDPEDSQHNSNTSEGMNLPLFNLNKSDTQPANQLKEAESKSKNDSIRSTLQRIASGDSAEELGDPAIKFYILGLSPNAGRISVRSWSVCNIGRLLENLASHFRDLAIVRSPKSPEFPSIKMLLNQTARESKDVPDILTGAVFRSIVEGLPYPEAFFAAVIRRIRADRQVNSIRAGIIKAALNRKFRSTSSNLEQEIPVSLDPNRPEPAYQMGRLFAALERNQHDALGDKLNATIKDRYFGAASATPGSVFPRLIRLSQHHLANLEGGRRVMAEKRMQEIMSRLSDFPAHLALADQGLFAIGYYHQVQDFYTKKDSKEQANQETDARAE